MNPTGRSNLPHASRRASLALASLLAVTSCAVWAQSFTLKQALDHPFLRSDHCQSQPSHCLGVQCAWFAQCLGR